MSGTERKTLERFRVSGNILKLTTRFDPRYQPRAGMEMMNIISSLSEESGNEEVVLDMLDAVSVPSVMLAYLEEARELTNRVGKKFKVRLKTSAYNRLQPLGVLRVFAPNQTPGDDSMELIAKDDAPP